jgi:hypothetical protein
MSVVICHRKFLEERCQQRGVPLGDAMKSVVGVDRQILSLDTKHPSFPFAAIGDMTKPRESARKKPPKSPRRRVAVGDLVERMLTGIGISKARVQQWLRVKDCGCAKRQRWLNQWGYKQQDRIERVLNRAARWYGIG